MMAARVPSRSTSSAALPSSSSVTTSSQTNIVVTVRVRPLTQTEATRLAPSTTSEPSSSSFEVPPIHKVVHVVDEQVIVFDPPQEPSRTNRWAPGRNAGKSNNPGRNNVIPAAISRRHKDVRYKFDRVFSEDTCQEAVYEETTRPLIDGVLNGFNSTVFAYGATGCGKTHTITGTPEQPGIIFLTMKELFRKITEYETEKTVEASLSYLEVYNEQIRDLLKDPAAPPVRLALREDARRGIVVAGLSEYFPKSVDEVMDLILRGNAARTMSPTEANAVSSRSHAVLQINIRQRPRTASIQTDFTVATLSLIDLAGSERASASKNKGDRLLEGANINRSLLALGNCINALCDNTRKSHIPYRDSKLTRLLKFSLGGNCKTVMIVCISPASLHYEETHNTLKYANRAKNIKTNVARNTVSVNQHVMQYVKIIEDLKIEVSELKKRLAEKSLSDDSFIDESGSALMTGSRGGMVQSVDTVFVESTASKKLRKLYEVIEMRDADFASAIAAIDFIDRRVDALRSWHDAYEVSLSVVTPSSSAAPDSYRTVVDTLIAELMKERGKLKVAAASAKEQADRQRQLVERLSAATIASVSSRKSTEPASQFEADRDLLERAATATPLEKCLLASKAALNQAHHYNRELMALNAQCLAGLKACVADSEKAGLPTAGYLNSIYMAAIASFTEVTKRQSGQLMPSPSLSGDVLLPGFGAKIGAAGSANRTALSTEDETDRWAAPRTNRRKGVSIANDNPGNKHAAPSIRPRPNMSAPMHPRKSALKKSGPLMATAGPTAFRIKKVIFADNVEAADEDRTCVSSPRKRSAPTLTCNDGDGATTYLRRAKRLRPVVLSSARDNYSLANEIVVEESSECLSPSNDTPMTDAEENPKASSSPSSSTAPIISSFSTQPSSFSNLNTETSLSHSSLSPLTPATTFSLPSTPTSTISPHSDDQRSGGPMRSCSKRKDRRDSLSSGHMTPSGAREMMNAKRVKSTSWPTAMFGRSKNAEEDSMAIKVKKLSTGVGALGRRERSAFNVTSTAPSLSASSLSSSVSSFSADPLANVQASRPLEPPVSSNNRVFGSLRLASSASVAQQAGLSTKNFPTTAARISNPLLPGEPEKGGRKNGDKRQWR